LELAGQGETWRAELPDNLAEKVERLGPPVAVFTVGGRALFLALVAGPLLFLAGLGVIVLSVLYLRHFSGKLLFLGGVAATAGVMMVVRAFRSRGLQVLVFPEGLLRLHRDAANAFLWEEIDFVRQRKIDGVWARLTKGALVVEVRRTDGTVVQFDDSLAHLKKLRNLLHQESLPVLLPRALNSLEGGGTLRFGELRVSREGLRKGAAALPWSGVGEVRTDDGTLRILQKGKRWSWFSAPTADLPNLHVLQVLLDYYATGARAPASGEA
jgi:hypothetical protein